MNDATFNFWTKWLLIANIMTVIVGLLAAFAGNSIFFEFYNTQTEAVFFEGQVLSEQTLLLKNWLFGIIGGSIVGFHLLMIAIIKNSFVKREKWAYNALWIGLLSWFCIDSSITIYYKAYHNLYLINLVALVLIALPLVMTRSYFKS
jgi:hypothetical protein